MKLTKDDLIAALRLRYDHYSAQTVFELARDRAGLADEPAYADAQVHAFRTALGQVGDRVERVFERLDSLLASGGGGGAPAPAPAPVKDAPSGPAPAKDAKDAKDVKDVKDVKDAAPAKDAPAAAPAAPATAKPAGPN